MDAPDSGPDNGRAQRVAEVEAELAAFAALDRDDEAATAARLRARAGSQVSAVFSVRLDHRDVIALEREARLLGIPPSVLARNLIRIGLAEPGRTHLSAMVEQIEQAVAGLRAMVT